MSSPSTFHQLQAYHITLAHDSPQVDIMPLPEEPEGPATKLDSDLASPPASIALEKKPLGFLDLPGELRNQIYAIAVADRDAISKDNEECIGFLDSSKQIRAECMPQYYLKNGPKYTVQVQEFPLFVQLMFLNRDIAMPRPSRVAININQVNVNIGFKWNMEAFIKATPKLRGIKWRICVAGERGSPVDRLAEGVKRVVHLPLFLLNDFETGYLSCVSFEHASACGENRSSGDMWTLTFAKKDVQKRGVDRYKLDEYRRFFPNCVFVATPTHML
jgi:hypothetical protein